MSLDCWSVDPRQRRQRAASAPLPPCLPPCLPACLPPCLPPVCLLHVISAGQDRDYWEAAAAALLFEIVSPSRCLCTETLSGFWVGSTNTQGQSSPPSPTFGVNLQVWRNFYQVMLSQFKSQCMWPHNTICLNVGFVICKMCLISCILAHRLINRGISKVWSLYGTHHHTNWPLFTVTIVPLTADVSRGWLCITESAGAKMWRYCRLSLLCFRSKKNQQSSSNLRGSRLLLKYHSYGWLSLRPK